MWPHTHTHTHTQVRCLCVSQVSCENFNKHGDKLKVSHRKWRLFSHSWISLHTVFDPTRTEHTLSSSTYSCSEPGAPDSRGRAHPVSTEKTLTENTNSTLLSEVSRTEASVRLSADDSSVIPALLHVFGRWKRRGFSLLQSAGALYIQAAAVPMLRVRLLRIASADWSLLPQHSALL